MKERPVSFVVAILIIVVVISSLVTVGLLYLFDTEPDEVRTLAYDFTVKDSVAFVLDTDALHFGAGPRGARLQRGLNITTTKAADVKVTWEGPGDLKVSENDFRLEANETKDLLFYLDIPSGIEDGYHTGTLLFSFYR